MKRVRVALLIFVSAFCGAADSPSGLAQHSILRVDWKAELAKAKTGIAKNPKSAYWHNQAGVAYDALGDFQNAVKEIKPASTLDSSDPVNSYTLYALYKRKAMHHEQRQVLLDVLEKDPNNPWAILNLPMSSKRRSIGQTLFGSIGWLSTWLRA